jgi:hypothetical protein
MRTTCVLYGRALSYNSTFPSTAVLTALNCFFGHWSRPFGTVFSRIFSVALCFPDSVLTAPRSPRVCPDFYLSTHSGYLQAHRISCLAANQYNAEPSHAGLRNIIYTCRQPTKKPLNLSLQQTGNFPHPKTVIRYRSLSTVFNLSIIMHNYL